MYDVLNKISCNFSTMLNNTQLEINGPFYGCVEATKNCRITETEAESQNRLGAGQLND